MATSRSSSTARLSRSAAAALRACGGGGGGGTGNGLPVSPPFFPSHRSVRSAPAPPPPRPRAALIAALASEKKVFSTPFSVSCFNRIASATIRPYSASAASPGQISNSEFTEMAWDGIVAAVDAARDNKHQVVETEHLMKALLEQKDGLARRIFTKAGIDNTSILQSIDNFISQQPKVSGDTAGPIVGSHLSSLLDTARKLKKEMGDSFLSVEHLVLAFPSDKRFGLQLFKNLQLSEKALKDAVQAVRGSQRVTDQSIF